MNRIAERDGLDAVRPVVVDAGARVRWWSRRPGLRLPLRRGTTANLSSLYPFHGGQTLPAGVGPYLGVNLTDGLSAWAYDPFDLYGVDLGGGAMLTNTNMLIVGEPGIGKSASVKTMLYRSCGYYQNRFVAVSDPKGEYGPLAAALGMSTVKLYPGGEDRLNPLDPGPGEIELSLLNRQSLLVGLLSLVARRELTNVEEVMLAVAIERLDRAHRGRKPATLIDLAHLLSTERFTDLEELTLLSNTDRDGAIVGLRLALSQVLRNTLRGMFDGPSTVRIDWASGNGLIVDLSAVFGNPNALPLVQMATTAWLSSQMAELQHQGRRGILVEDEVWATMADQRAARNLQSRLKLCRKYGIWNILITHRLSDLRSQADDGTAASKIGAGLLADIQTRVVFRQSTDEIAGMRSLLRFNSRQAEVLPRLGQGQAMWVVAGRTAIVEHVIAAHEWVITDTDSAMAA